MSRVRENRTHGSTGGDWKRSTLARDAKMNSGTGNRSTTGGFATYRQELPPRQPPTLRAGVVQRRYTPKIVER